MFKRIAMLSTTLLTAFLVMSAALVPAIASADSSTTTNVNYICQGVDATTGKKGSCPNPGADSAINNFITTIINTLSWIVGIIAVVMVMVGGFKFVTSGGDTEKVVSARSTIIYALVGLVIVAMAQVIVHFVIGRFA